MTDLVQVVYISRATFKAMPASGGVEPHVARILQQSRTNNPRLGLGGVLYYGEGCFFQCLEGEREVVDKMLAKLKGDDRHKDFKVVLQRNITERQFTDWSMKYIPTNAAVKGLLARAGYDRFDPYQFDQKTIEDLLTTFRELRAQADRAIPSHAAQPEVRANESGAMPYVVAGVVVLACAVAVGWFVL
ncbi:MULTISPECIES: BLUF domain-containing protein [unclassified Marinimicrobium]|jgi:hypothetical protein|uniref:BLUF domain-containing protein n=1 Tax=unclassified Marinimicrobium TaxID=2632100 RepID=UPI00257B344B|nr:MULTISPECIES: BLUF domain-containing protein [unclassified Marinimicrobium]